MYDVIYGRLLSIKLGLFASAMGAVALLVVRGVFGLLWERGRAWRLGFVVFIGTLIAPWSWEVADFLSSGNAVKDLSYVWAIRIGLAFAAEVFFAAIMLWQLRVSFRITAHSTEQAAPTRMDYGLLFVPGVLAVGLLMWLTNSHLDAYHRLAQLLMIPLFVIASTVVAVPLSRFKKTGIASLVVLGLSIAFMLAGSLRIQNNHQISLSRGSKTAELTTGLLGLYNPSWMSRIDITGLKGTTCEAPTYSSIADPVPVDRNKVKNVILISIDALRADAINWVTPDGRPIMPNLFEFSKRSLVYSNAVTSYPSTAYSLASMVTGLSPSRIVLSQKRPENFFTRTSSQFDTQFVIVPKIKFFKTRICSEIYFQKAESVLIRKASAQNPEFINRLNSSRANGERTLAWLHYYEPHLPHKKHIGLDFGRDKRGLYMGELAFVDSHFGLLVRHLEQDGWLDNSIVVVFSDHGEALGERGYRGHNIYLDSWITDIAMMIRAPGIEPGIDNHLRSIADLAPTIQHFAGVDVQEGISGRSLFAEPEESRFVVGEAFPFRGKDAFRLSDGSLGSLRKLQKRIDKLQGQTDKGQPRVSYVSNDYRLIVTRDSGEINLYDRKADPEELNDLAEQKPELVNSILKTLSEWHDVQSKRIYCGFKKKARK